MLKLNGLKITPTIFPDKTSQVWKIPLPDDYNAPITIYWEFESESEFMHLAQLVNLLRYSGYFTISLYMPYLPYGRQDKNMSNNSTFALSTFARLINSLDILEITVIDAHSDSYKLIKRCKNIYPEKEIGKVLELVDPHILAFPDTGACVRYSSHFQYPVVVGHKVRNQETGYIEKYDIDGSNPKGRDVLIIDDICDGGMTFILLAKELLNHGARSVNLYTTHGIFSKGVRVLKDAGISRIFTFKGEVFESKDTNFLIKMF